MKIIIFKCFINKGAKETIKRVNREQWDSLKCIKIIKIIKSFQHKRQDGSTD